MTATSTTTGTNLAAVKAQLANESPLMPRSDLHAWHQTLVFAPHPDDESLGCGGLIALLRARGQNVQVIFTSDGAMSHPNSVRYDRAARVALREKEALAACRQLGVAETDVTFLRYPDTAVPRQHQPGFESAAVRIRGMVEALAPTHILVPWRRDPHCDHRATWELCRTAVSTLAEAPKWIEYPIWMWNADRAADLPRTNEVIAWRLDISDVLATKWKAVEHHVSQLTPLINDDPAGFQLSSDMLDNFRHSTELYFEDADKQQSSLSTAYFEGVYTQDDDPWNFTTSKYELDKYRHSIRSLNKERYSSVLEIGCSIGVLTKLLAGRSERLLAIDIAEKPLVQARKRLAGNESVAFQCMAIPLEFPDERFDLIVVSEVGYYWSVTDLGIAIKKIKESLVPGGEVLLVHFTPYVPDYPLTGDEVHAAFATAFRKGYRRLTSERAARYRLESYRKE